MTLFEEIYEAAKSGNNQALETIKRGNFYILDVSNGLSVPIEQLAFEGNHEAVRLLTQLGASISNAVCGYARGGDNNEGLVTRLLEQGAHLNYAVEGAARGGHHALVTRLLGQGANQNWAVEGAAKGGHEGLVARLLGQGANQNNAVAGAARGNHEGLVTRLLGQGADQNTAVRGAAGGGHEGLAARLRNDNVVARYRRAGKLTFGISDNSWRAATFVSQSEYVAPVICLLLARRRGSAGFFKGLSTPILLRILSHLSDAEMREDPVAFEPVLFLVERNLLYSGLSNLFRIRRNSLPQLFSRVILSIDSATVHTVNAVAKRVLAARSIEDLQGLLADVDMPQSENPTDFKREFQQLIALWKTRLLPAGEERRVLSEIEGGGTAGVEETSPRSITPTEELSL